MSTLETVIAAVPDTQLSLGGFLKKLRGNGRLRPLLRAALAEQLMQAQARQAGLSVTTEELQTAADAFRRTNGLHTVADTRAWLTSRGLSEADFEAGLEEELLANKLRQHLTAAAVEDHFRSHQAEYDRLRVTLLVVPRLDLAEELASAVREDGRTLAEAATQHGLRLIQGERFRKQLHSALADALTAAREGDLVGPVVTPHGFALAVVAARVPAALDGAIRRRIENELFDRWLAEKLGKATFQLELVGTT
jgi:putative peptide maturation system protein